MPGGWPMLGRAPARMVRGGAIAGLIVVAVALLAGLVSAGPLFGAAAASGGLAQRLASIPDTAAPSQRPAVRVSVQDGPTSPAEQRIRSLVKGIPYLGNARSTIVADAFELDVRHPVPYIEGAGGRQRIAVLYYSSVAEPTLQIASGTRGAPGLWVPEAIAGYLGVGPGSTVHLKLAFGSGQERETAVPVAGTYRTGPDGHIPAGSFLDRVDREVPDNPDPSSGGTIASLLIADRATIDTAIAALDEQPLWTYDAALTPAGRTPDRLRAAAASTAQLRLQAAEPGSSVAGLFRAPGTFRIDSGLPAIQAQAAADAKVAREQGRGIAYAGGILGIAAVLLALRALAQRRRRETELLVGLGTPTGVVVLAGSLELLLPVALGAVLGWAAAVAAFGLAGPDPGVDADALGAAALGAMLVAVATLAGQALISLAELRRVSRSLTGQSVSRFGSQWLPLLTGATALAVYATLSRTRGQSYADPLAALLPILVLACGCAIVARAAAATTGAVRRWRAGRIDPASAAARSAPEDPQREPSADLLVVRGLRRTGVAVADLVVVLAIGIGILAYGLSCAAQVRQSVDDKAAVLAGAPTTVHVEHSWLLKAGEGPAPNLGRGSTVVWRASSTMTPDDRNVDILVVNPDTLRDAASWGSGPDLATAKAALASFPAPPPDIATTGRTATAPLPALLVGDVGRAVGGTGQVQVSGSTIPFHVTQHLAAFPGASTPTVVLDARTLFPRLSAENDPSHQIARGFDVSDSYAAWIWTEDSLSQVQQRLAAVSVPPLETFTLAQARATPELTSSRWAAAYQVVLGLAAALLGGLALVVAVDRRVAKAAAVDLVLRRFGFRPARLLRLRATELMLTALGALAVLCVPLVLMLYLMPRLIEPAPALSPAMVPGTSVSALLLSVLAAAAVTGLAVVVAARRSASLRPGEVLRDE